ncbi:MAG: hypothetical protein BEN19_05105 [Epulopiscium sp. Nuni2H_MBin003]|nr:MAG: hypothetical protein BEN19_05105 [Epulopiscium sp. Nuni2H_MBin003]
MEQFNIIKQKIKQSGYTHEVDIEELYNLICDEIEDKISGEYIFMLKVTEDTHFEIKVEIFEEEFNLASITIQQNGQSFYIELE